VFSGIGPIKFNRLIERFDSAKEAWRASKYDLEKLLGKKLTAKFDDFRSRFSIPNYIKKLSLKGVSFLTLSDKEYPKLLSEIKNAPFLLYIRGDRQILYSAQNDPSSGSGQAKYIAVVGTRRATQYGREVTKILTEELVASGFTIVSGLAIGIDAISHKTAIENAGMTIAVLGCGVDCCYPRENQSIYNSIVGKGVIISEFPLGMKPTQWTFPSRNRIIAGLSDAVLVTEGAEDSGSLITANYAIKFNRKVFAVPGPVTSTMSKGPYKLISKGAKLVTKAEDIFKELKTQMSEVKTTTKKSKLKDATVEEKKILKLLEDEALHFDELVRKTGMQPSDISSLLSVMEIKGAVKGLNGGVFSIL